MAFSMVLGQRNPTPRMSYETVAGAPVPDDSDSLLRDALQCRECFDADYWAEDTAPVPNLGTENVPDFAYAPLNKHGGTQTPAGQQGRPRPWFEYSYPSLRLCFQQPCSLSAQ